MSYRVDIPTLSANEVYTLTFEYGGTETIQLVVGDLTLETTDRRVVFTTTSPVNYIESNMNLTNLNIYEGYYESDDFGGEYTQESYIEGMSLINYKRRVDYGTLINNANIQETFTDDGYVNYKQLGTGATGRGFRGNGFAKNIDQSKNYTIILRVRKNTFPVDVFVPFTLCHKDCGVKFDETVKGDYWGISYNISGRQTGVWKAVVIGSSYNVSMSGRYWGSIYSFLVDENSEVTDLTQRTDIIGCEIEYAIEVLQGDYFDIDTGIDEHFEGIGCVKSPTIKSLSPENLYVSPLKYREPLRGYEYYHNDGTVEIYPNGGGVYSTIDLYTGEDVGLSYTGSQRTWYVNNGIKLGLGAGTYYFCCEIELVANKQITDFACRPQIDVVYDEAQYFSVNGNLTETYDGKKYYYKGIFGVSNKTVTDDIRGIYVGIWSYGISGVEKYIIRNITLTKEASLKDICAISKSSIITTPDDLELYSFTDTWDNITIADSLDLTTGIVTKNVGILDITDINALIYSGYDSTNDLYNVSCSFANFPNIVAKGNDTRVSSNILERKWYTQEGLYSHGIGGKFEIRLSGTGRGITSEDEAKQWVIDNLIMFYERTPEIIQLDINPLKSYHNGSIQTSSQQLTPTLKTTLPISNKFTTTNLTSGSTYNVYFDGTATRLDAGGTIITNPISPCEVECGGTTLTIEGTDIQNVKVLETTNKNEVGSVCGTTDVELSRIKTKCGIHNIFDDYFQGSHNTNWAKDYYCTSTRDDTTVKIVGKSSLNYAGYSLVESLPFGTYKLHYKVKVSTIGDKYKVALSSNPNGTPQDAYVPVTDVTSTALVEEQTFVFYKKHITNMLFYTYRNGQEIEYYDISLIKLSDEDITGTDTSNINYSQVISDLEQPIKLRSLGTTYDSYNPVTGILTKRIGVSETDGSYSVLSSPIVNQVEIDNIPHLYTNGQVKVYSDSDVYPTTILNGQSTNNYEINELKTSNNYTIRYEGECESINLANKSNEQGTNRIVKAGATSGNLTFVNDNGDIDNVLLVQNDVREQEINHFTGLQTVEVSRMLIQNQGNMWWNDWITPSEYGTSWQVDSPEFIPVQPSETIYVVANNNNYTSLFEFDENYNIVNQGKDLILSNEANPKPIDLGNGYYKNYKILSENTRYIKFSIPVSTASTAKSETRWSTISFTRADIGNVPLYTNNTPYRGSIINLPQPVQLNSLPDGTCDTYNPITGEYVQNVGTIQLDSSIVNWNKTWSLTSSTGYSKLSHVEDWGEPSYKTLVNEYSMPNALTAQNSISNNATMSREFNGGWSYWGAVDFGVGKLAIIIPREFPGGINEALQYLDENPLIINYKRTEPIVTQLTPINIPTFEGGIVQLITTDGKVFPMIEYSMPTNNRYDTSSWEAGKVYTQRNMTEVYFNESTTPMTPTETMTLTTEHLSKGSIILNDNGNGLIVLKGNYTGRDIPYFTGMRSVEAIEVETTPSPDQPLFGKGGRR